MTYCRDIVGTTWCGLIKLAPVSVLYYCIKMKEKENKKKENGVFQTLDLGGLLGFLNP